MLAAVLAGCAQDNPFPDGKCTLASIGDMPVLSARFSPIIPVTLNGGKVAMKVDTGAASSMLSGSIADKLDLARMPSNQLVQGADGSAFASFATVDQLGVGIGQIRNLALLVTPAPMQGSIDGLPMAGLFGGDFLYNYVDYFDLPDRQFSLYREYNCPRAHDLDIGWENGFYVLPFTEGLRGRGDDPTKISFRILINGRKVDAILDSGAWRTSVSLDDAHGLGVTDADLAHDPTTRYSGILGSARRGWVHRFASLDIGPEHFTDVPLEVADDDLPTLLGADFIRTHRMLVSYRRDKIFIERHSHPQPPSPALGQPQAAQGPAPAHPAPFQGGIRP